MAERVDSRIWTLRGVFVVLACALMAAALVPLDMRPSAWAGPDMLLALTMAWIARQPSALPVAVVAIIFLMADLLLMRPPGLWAALVVVLTEAIRRRHSEFRSMSFLAEWGAVAGGIIAIGLAYRTILFILAVPRAPLGLSAMETAMTILVYPVVVILAHYLFGIRKTVLSDAGGRRQTP
jgi:rod shape-determining protein MreD